MAQGWIRSYGEELKQVGASNRSRTSRDARARFRSDFRTQLHKTANDQSPVLAELSWSDVVELPAGLSNQEMTAATFGDQSGFIASNHVVEVAYIVRRGKAEKGLKANLRFQRGGKTLKKELLWGDCVQIIEKGPATSKVRSRGSFGEIDNSDLSPDALLEVYFIDVGQGDGVLVRTPDGRHLLMDGGLERNKQLTGKNAADFIDWKFFQDYGDFRVRLDSMTASHSDNDHYLVRESPAADRELDCLGTNIATLHHPGLSRWERRDGANPPHADKLGPKSAAGNFVRLLGDREDVEGAIVNGAEHELSGPWKSFLKAVVEHDASTLVERVGLSQATLRSGGPLPEFWPAGGGCSIRVLGPVTVEEDGQPALPDLGQRSINTNGHSICLRIDYGKARILLTADLNKASMDWLRESYGDRIAAFECDVAKACHHGSHDISLQFLEAMRPAATIISSGDAEGHGHPRPEVVGASAVTGFLSVSRQDDRLLTPLIYMTEIERSVSVGAVNRIDFKGLPGEDGPFDGILPGRHLDELSAAKRLSPTEEAEIARLPEAERRGKKRQLVERLRRLEEQALDRSIKATYYYSVPQGPLSAKHKELSVWRSRVMEKNHYGLVNVRTDGNLVMCATLNETEEDWIIHTFPARFPEV